jgi:hypothetical protein
MNTVFHRLEIYVGLHPRAFLGAWAVANKRQSAK